MDNGENWKKSNGNMARLFFLVILSEGLKNEQLHYFTTYKPTYKPCCISIQQFVLEVWLQ